MYFNSKAGYGDRAFELNCGQCMSCRRRKREEWMIRCVHEAQMHSSNSFLTLTYSDKNLPEDRSLKVEHFQKFMQDLRDHRAEKRGKKRKKIRYFHCGEYGPQTLRPHYHCVLFGEDFEEDSVHVETGPKGHRYYMSATLAELWPYGRHMLGQVSKDTAAYVAKYTQKKVTGPPAEEHYTRTDPTTGEQWTVKSEYSTMSRRPGLGATWFERYWPDVYPSDEVVLEGRKYKPPKYYDHLLEQMDPTMWEEVRKKRVVNLNEEEQTYRQRRKRETKEKGSTNVVHSSDTGFGRLL